MEEFDKLCSTLLETAPTKQTEAHIRVVVEALAKIVEYVVYGDVKDEHIFLLFCEKRLMRNFLLILHSYPQPLVQMQILQTISIICQSVRSETSLYFLLSNNVINEIIMFPFAFNIDEDILPNYLSLLKSISLLLNDTSVQFFIAEPSHTIPLLSKAIALLGVSEETMVRVGAQVTILNILRLEDERCRAIITNEAILHEFSAACVTLLESSYRRLYNVCLQQLLTSISPSNRLALSREYSEVVINIEDWLFFLRDVLQLRIPLLSAHVIKVLMTDFLYLSILEPLIQLKALKIDLQQLCAEDLPSSALSTYTSAQVSLLITSLIFEVQPSIELLSSIIIAIFHPLSRRERKKRLYALLLALPPEDTAEPTEMNPYRIVFKELRENRREDRLFLQTSFALFWISDAIYKATEHEFPVSKELEADFDCSIQRISSLLFLLSSLGLLPRSEGFADILSSTFSTTNHQTPTQDIVRDPDLIDLLSTKELECIAKLPTDGTSFLQNLQEILTYFSVHSLLSIQISATIIYNYVCSIGALFTFLGSVEEASVQRYSRVKDFCTAALGSLMGILKVFYNNIVGSLCDKASGVDRIFVFELLLEEYKDFAVKYKVEKCIADFKLKSKSDKTYTDMEILATEEGIIRKEVKSFFLAHDILCNLSRRFGVPIEISLQALDEALDDSALPRTGDKIDVHDKLAFVVSIANSDGSCIPVTGRLMLVLEATHAVLACDETFTSSASNRSYPTSILTVLFTIPLIRVYEHLLAEYADEPICILEFTQVDAAHFPFLLLLQKPAAASSWELLATFDDIKFRDIALDYINRNKDSQIDKVLAVFGEPAEEHVDDETKATET